MSFDKDSKLSPPSLGKLPAILFNVSAALASIALDKAEHKAAPNQWSKKEELGHLVDSAIVNHQRIIRTAVEDNPTMPGYDGERWVSFQQYKDRSWIEIIKLWQAANEQLLAGLESVSDQEWKRSCTVDNESHTLSSLVESYINHMIDHLGHIGVDTNKLSEDRSRERKAVYPEKPAATATEINELMERRWSPRLFEDRAVETQKIDTLLEAARWAPSCFNEQPWRYLVFDGSDPEALDRARACLVEGNAWAKEAPVLMLSVAKENFTQNDKKNPTAHHDVGLASENLVLQAVEIGLAAHQMAGFDGNRARQEFHIPDGFTPLAMIALGYPHSGSLDDLPEKTREKERAKRTRKRVGEFAFNGAWDKPYTDRQ